MTKWAGKQIKEKYHNGCHLKTVSQNDLKNNQHILGTYVHIHTKYEVSMTFYSQLSIDSKPMKSTKCGLPFKN